jgi:hypothetical protein
MYNVTSKVHGKRLKNTKAYSSVYVVHVKGFFIILASAPLLVWQSGGFDVCFEAC